MDSEKKTSFDSKKLSTILFFVFLAGFILCAVMVGSKIFKGKAEQEGYDRLAEIVAPTVAGEAQDSAASAPGDTAENQAQPTPRPLSAENLDKLVQMNSDFFGWISIPGTAVNYPVVYTPTDPDYYLRRDFYGKKAEAGVPFLGDGCKAKGNAFIIHGHNMKNGTMFADIMKYRSADYCTQHPYIQFDTPTTKGTFEVIGAFQYDAQDRPDLDFRLYDYTGKLSNKHFNEYLAYVQEHSLYQTGVNTSYGDVLLTLSTCTNGAEFDRFIVVARKTNKLLAE